VHASHPWQIFLWYAVPRTMTNYCQAPRCHSCSKTQDFSRWLHGLSVNRPSSFLKTVPWVMGYTKYPFLPNKLDSLHKGRHDHNGSCLPYGPPIVMLIEDRHGNPRKGMNALPNESQCQPNFTNSRKSTSHDDL
jgi:hypothetical protein